MSEATFHNTFAAALDDAAPDASPSWLPRQDATRFSVYRNNVHRALGTALADAYPAVARLVGEEFFSATARVFHAQEPKRTASLSLHGAGFASFLETFPPVQHLVYLCDVARVERAWLEALHAADAPVLNAARVMAELDRADDLTFSPHPATRVVVSLHPAVTIWQANRPETTTPITESLLDVPEAALITRPDAAVVLTSIDRTTATFASALFAGTALAQSYAAALKTDPDFDLTQALAALIASGALSSIAGDRP